MEEEIDPFDFQLAESLSMTLGEMNDRMTTNEYASWKAYHKWHNAQIELARRKAKADSE